jgi:hypothetical protein
LQQTLLKIVKAISTPNQLDLACIERWKKNTESLHQVSKRQFEELVEAKKPYQYIQTDRIRFISERLDKASLLLYVGCGRGTQCLSFANQDHNVIGIDTNFALIESSNTWARYLDVPFKAICMDVMDLGFTKEAFDSFLMEFYGYQSSMYQSLLLQRNLAWVLRKRGRGFVVASRKNYASFWFFMGTFYPIPMARWLAHQAGLDYRWGKGDGHKEKLMYGLYYRSHTVDSLSKELGYAFNVIECLYEKDPRYVICTVEPKENLASLPDPEYSQVWEGDVSDFPESGDGSIVEILGYIESICNFLESHEINVMRYFQDGSSKGKNPLQRIPVDVAAFLRLLELAFRNSPDFKILESPTHHFGL